ncbi:hypothetical protein RUND412_002091 [Rhizina undulata]
MVLTFSKISLLSTWTLVCVQVALTTARVTPIKSFGLPRASFLRNDRSRLLNFDNEPDGVDGGTFLPASNNSQELQYFELPVDHFGDGSAGTFRNRYWVDDTYYQPGGPIFLYDVGEDNAEPTLNGIAYSGPMDYVKTFNGLLIIWEHRFYGRSMPSITFSLTTENVANFLQFLTIEQALEDVAVFARNFTYSKYPNEDMTPGNVPWIFIGASYSGARAAWSRVRNPELWHASLGSSATVELQVDNWQYYRIIEEYWVCLCRAMQNGYSNCSADLKAVADWMNSIVDDGNMTAIDDFMLDVTGGSNTELFAYFSNSSSGYSNITDYRLSLLEQNVDIVFTDFQNFGMQGQLGYYCDSIQILASREKGNNILDVGIVTTYGLPFALSIHAAVLGDLWSYYINSTDNGGLTSPLVLPQNDLQQRDVGEDCSGANQAVCMDIITKIGWTWQSCTEFGNLHTYNASFTNSFIPMFISVDYAIRQCEFYFGPAVSTGPNIEPIDQKYGGWNMNPTNAFFTTGQYDPWRAVSLNSVEENSPKRVATSTIPAAGELPADGHNFGYVLKNGLHGSDMNYNPVLNATAARNSDRIGFDWNEAAIAHELFAQALTAWLPAFTRHGTAVTNSSGGGSSATTSASGSGASPTHSRATRFSCGGWAEKMSLVLAVVVAMGFVNF